MSAYLPTLELAPSANLGNDPSTWSWQDYTDRVWFQARITRQWGRTDRFPSGVPARLAWTFTNDDGLFVPDNPTSALYGLIDENTPVRLMVAPAENSASDAFARTSSSSWGSADVGGAWTNVGTASDYSVASASGGRHTSTAANVYHWSTLAFSLSRIDIKVRIRVNALSTGANQDAGITFRFTSSTANDRVELQFATSGAITIAAVIRSGTTDFPVSSAATGLTHSTSSWYWLRVQTGRTSCRAKAWLDGTSEPRGWQLDAAQSTAFAFASGAVGVYSRRETGNTNANATTDFDDFSMQDGPYILQTCHVDEWPTAWSDSSGNQSLAPMTASGRLRLIQSFPTQHSSTYEETIQNASVVAYWPMEDKTSSTTFASAVTGGITAVPGGFTFAADSEVLGSDTLPTVGSLGRCEFPVGPYAASSTWAVRFLIKIPQSPATSAQVLSWSTPGGTFARWQLTWFGNTSPDTMRLEGYNSAGAATLVDTSVNMVDSSSNAELSNGRQLYIEVNGVQNGANIDLSWNCWYNPDDGTAAVGLGHSTSVAGTLANVTLLSHDAGSGWTTTGAGQTIGHIAVGSDVGIGAGAAGVNAFAGEQTSIRLARVAGYDDIPYYMGEILTGTSSVGSELMGQQQLQTLFQHLQQIEAAELGILFDGRQGQVTIMPRSIRYNHAVNLALDFHQGHVSWPWTRASGGLQRVTEVTARNPKGSEAVARASAALIQQVGVKQQQVEPNTAYDSALRFHADWWLAQGSERQRYPQIPIKFHSATSLIRSYLEMDVGGRVTLANPPVQLPPDALELIAEGGQDVIDPFEWNTALNCSSGARWLIGVWDAGKKYDCGACTVAAPGLTTSATSLNVAIADQCTWTHADGNYDILVAGERMTVTAVSAAAGSGSSWTQTLTVTRSVNGVVKTHAAGEAVHIADPFIWGV